MRVLCAWCQVEGKPSLLRVVEPLEDPAETHGVCESHRGILLAEARAHGGRVTRTRSAA